MCYRQTDRQDTDDITRRRYFELCVFKDTDTYSEHVILIIIFHDITGYANAPHCYVMLAWSVWLK
jgi:hypothetical protein